MLRSAGHNVIEVDTAQDARRWLRIHRADMGIIDLGTTASGGVEELREVIGMLGDRTNAVSRTEVLLLARPERDAQMRALFDEHRLRNFIAVGADEALDPVEVSVTVAKILSNDIFGAERYLSRVTGEQVFNIRSSTMKESVITAAEEFATTSGCNPRISQQVATAVDELITNAVYNAPVDEMGKPRFAHVDRTVPVELEASEEVCLRLICDGHRIGVSARDPFGSLTPERVLEYLAKCYLRGDSQVDAKEGGAGLGLYFLFNLLNSFILNISPGRATEVIGLFTITKSFKTFAKRPKSFNIFVEHH